MTDNSESIVEFTSVKVITKCGNMEVVYDIPHVEDFQIRTEYEDLEALMNRQIINKESKITLLSFSMEPVKVDRKMYTITRISHAIKVTEDIL